MNLRNLVLTLIVGGIGGILGTVLVSRGVLPGIIPAPAPGGTGTLQTAPNASVAPGALAYEEQVISTVKAASPAVVSIIVTKDVPVIERYFEEVPTPFSPFGDFFGNDPFSPFSFQIPRYRERGTEEQEVGGGSGFLVSAEGHIVTNRHVVAEEGVEYTVFTNEGEKFAASVVARDPVNDIAVIKIDGQNLPFLEFGDSDALQVGQTVIAIGTALSEFRNTVSRGVVSGLSRSIVASGATGGPEQLEEVIQTDAAINPGNSGGPLIDLAGHVVGVNVAVAIGSENIGFALPANVVRETVETVRTQGRIVRPYLGIRYTPITPVLREQNNLSVDYGVLVVRGESADMLAVLPGSPANRAGIVEGDIILEFDGKRLDEETSLAQLIRKKKVGETATLKVLSRGQEKTVTVTLEEMPQ